MDIIKLQAASAALIDKGRTCLPTLIRLFSFIVVVKCFRLAAAANKDAIKTVLLPLSTMTTIRTFYSRRLDFFEWGFRTTGKSAFRFNLLQNHVLAVSGEEGRRIFFSSKGFDINQGFKNLAGAIPILAGVTSDLSMQNVALIHKRLGSVQTRENLSQHAQRYMNVWDAKGSCDPFDKIHELVFQLAVRALSCAEIADDAKTVARLKSLYDTLDRGTTPAAVLAPWFPSPAIVRNTWTTKCIYDIIVRAIDNRKMSGKAGNDTLQVLLDQNTEPHLIVAFMLGLIVAGSRSTGTTASWMLTFVGSHPEWRERAKKELEHLVTSFGTAHTKASLSAQLSSIPLDAWEEQTPVLDSLIRETLRLAQPHVAMRRNLGPDVYVDGNIVPTGTYVVYPFSDVHLDSNIYPEPLKFDPSRQFDPKQTAFAYVGFGGGNVVCAGQRLARLMAKVVAAMLLLGFDYEIVNEAGELVSPQPDWNDHFTCRSSTTQDQCRLSFSRSVPVL